MYKSLKSGVSRQTVTNLYHDCLLAKSLTKKIIVCSLGSLNHLCQPYVVDNRPPVCQSWIRWARVVRHQHWCQVWQINIKSDSHYEMYKSLKSAITRQTITSLYHDGLLAKPLTKKIIICSLVSLYHLCQPYVNRQPFAGLLVRDKIGKSCEISASLSGLVG